MIKKMETSENKAGGTEGVQHWVICYRCGWCGQPTNKDGQVLTLEVINSMDVDWDKAEQTHGDCCRHEQEDRRIQVTREMAMDAGEPDMEGMWIER